jgi:GntR family transcriptional regulator/MocR family aminotransferase
MDPIFELDVSLPTRGSRSLLQCLHQQLRVAILNGRLRMGLRLPPTRELAKMLGISRNTVIAAYDMLLSEGYLVARPGAGHYVTSTLPHPLTRKKREPIQEADPRLKAVWSTLTPVAPRPSGADYRFDFRIGVPDKMLFPFVTWNRLQARALRLMSRTAESPMEPEGRPELREAIANHVSFSRAVACRPDEVVVTSGAQQGFDLLTRILVTPRRTTVAMEEPGYPPLREAFLAAGAEILPIQVDGEGLRVDLLPERARIICVTPSHQFPLGSIMSLQRRGALLDFAQSHGAVVIEDDYDSEFRFGGRPLDALHTLDRAESVFYVGTFSKSLFAEIRLGFIIAPPWARQALIKAKQLMDWQTLGSAQDTLAAFIHEGHLARHVRKVRKVYEQRRTSLQEALTRHFGGRLELIPGSAGLHLSAKSDSTFRADELVVRAAAEGIRLQSFSRYIWSGPGPSGLAFGYGQISGERIEEGVARLAQVHRRTR